jgi:hypothetical protein
MRAWFARPLIAAAAVAPDQPGSQLNSVAVISTRDAWVVGLRNAGNGVIWALIEHWNGKAWSRVPAPGLPGDVELFAVTATSSSNAWAVGNQVSTGTPLIEHWNGSAWTVMTSPNPIPGYTALTAVAATSARDAWAVGVDSEDRTVILRWNGTVWKISPSPADAALGAFESVTAMSPRDAWAAGWTVGPGIIHWNGKTWK